MRSYLLFIPTLAVIVHSASHHQTPEERARQQNDQRFDETAYHGQPWEEYSGQGFFPRDAFPPTLTSDSLVPTRTVPISLIRRASFDAYGCALDGPNNCYTFSCPTSIECNDGGCCPLGNYCAIKSGQIGCCSLAGPPCDTDPIPGCSLSCYGICCDLVQDIIGEPVCSPTVGAEGQASGVCTGVGPSNSLFTTPTNCPGNEFLCGSACCPGGSGLICDNTTIPDSPFCNIPP